MYLVFGEDRSNYQQALFSILTLLPQLHKNEEIIVVTDSPKRFKIIHDHIKIVEVDTKTIDNWKGAHENFFRIKIKAMLYVVKMIKNKTILYFDADTFLFGSFDNLRSKLENNSNIMHTNEGKLSASTSKSQKPLWKSLKGKTIENIPINENLCMWNAGVIGVSKTNSDALQIALNLCDTISEMGVKPRLIEQLSFSIALSNGGTISPADTEIGHYWGNKIMWNEKIEDVFLCSFFNVLSVEELISKIKFFDFEATPILVKPKDTKIRLQGFLNNVFKDKKVEFIKKSDKH
ncbi:MAG: hypothetical protein ACSHXF_05665 [Aquaticitalea sp.]